jgi:hypothetical protein
VGASATQHIVQHMFRDTSRDEDVSAVFILVGWVRGAWGCLGLIGWILASEKDFLDNIHIRKTRGLFFRFAHFPMIPDGER